MAASVVACSAGTIEIPADCAGDVQGARAAVGAVSVPGDERRRACGQPVGPGGAEDVGGGVSGGVRAWVIPAFRSVPYPVSNAVS